MVGLLNNFFQRCSNEFLRTSSLLLQAWDVELSTET